MVWFDIPTEYQPNISAEYQPSTNTLHSQHYDYKTDFYQPKLESGYQLMTGYQPSEQHGGAGYQPSEQHSAAGYQPKEPDCQPIEYRWNTYPASTDTWPLTGLSAKNIKRIKTLMSEQRYLRRASTGSLPPGALILSQVHLHLLSVYHRYTCTCSLYWLTVTIQQNAAEKSITQKF